MVQLNDKIFKGGHKMRCYPDYYEDFKCIAQKCTHNCCIGWEIDIDDDTLSFYENLNGEFADRFKKSICYDDTPHFILDENERCPFLNKSNLCDIITAFGEEHIGDICKEHPRFHNELPDRVESGLGLCCEQACKIILTKKEKTVLLCDEKYDTDDEIIILRDKVIQLLQNRERTLSDRIDDMLTLCDTKYIKRTLKEYAQVLLSLEILDEEWKRTLCTLDDDISERDIENFSQYIKGREHEFEQLCVYFIYRHFANSPDIMSTKQRACFTAFVFDFFYKMGAFSLKHTGSYTTSLHLDLARTFSSEIEYSDENIYFLYDFV